ncbi:MAG: hypothetical protein ACRDG3_01570 [Tepidiformaceae bacterium]
MATIFGNPASQAGGESAVSRTVEHLKHDAAYQAFWILRAAFTTAPILFGLDKFFHILVNWDIYFAPRLNDIIPGTAHQFMGFVGVVEIVAGLVVAFQPRYGSYLVAAWLCGIVVNLLLIPGFYDVALRDFGLLLAALAFARLASVYAPGWSRA